MNTDRMAEENKPTAAEAQAQLRYLQSIYSQQYELLENEIATFTMAMGSLHKNLETLENKDRLSNSKILVSGEGGAYIEASVKSLDKALVYIGAGYLVEKSIEDAKAYLKGNGSKQEETVKKLISERQKLEKEMMDVSYKLSILDQGQAPGATR